MKRDASYFEKERGGFSLLHPAGASSNGGVAPSLELSPAAAQDLGLGALVAAFTPNREHQSEVRELFLRLPRDPAVIAYRQEVLEDLLANPALVERLTSLFPLIDSLFDSAHRLEREMTWLHQVVWRAGELQNMIDCFEGMAEALRSTEGTLHSDGLRRLGDEIQEAQSDPTYKSLVRELPGLLARLQEKASLTIGVNLDASLRPVQATLLSVNEKPFTGQSLLNRLFGAQNDREGIAPLHSVPQRSTGMPYALGEEVDPLMVPLFADLARVLEKTAIPVADRLRAYANLHGELFTDLRQALVFYLSAVRFLRRFAEHGLEMCRPQIAPADERRCEVKGSYNVPLALRALDRDGGAAAASIVRNDIHMGAEGRILILTGPNRGGKTTYMQGVGVVHVLAQAGLRVPGVQAVLSPLDHLFTHFPLEEKPESDAGRFGEEAMRLRRIFEEVTRHSLVLLNESLSSTSFSESLYLAQDLMRVLRRVGARAIYSTHLHELANRADELNASAPGDSTILSIVASPVEGGADGSSRSYKLEVRPPLGQSYAREIASRYGISYEQLEQALSKRGILTDHNIQGKLG